MQWPCLGEPEVGDDDDVGDDGDDDDDDDGLPAYSHHDKIVMMTWWRLGRPWTNRLEKREHITCDQIWNRRHFS